MTDQELNDRCARAMGWEIVSVEELRRQPYECWADNERPRFRVDCWHPATDWRDTGIVLEWLSTHPEVYYSIILGNTVTVIGAELDYNEGEIPLADIDGTDLQRAICVAAIAVGATNG